MKTCVTCGGKITLVDISKQGTMRRFKSMMLTVPDAIMVPTCTGCGAEYHGATEAEAIDASLGAKFDAILSERGVELTKKLMVHTRLWKIEWLLGLSHGYLSKVRHKKRVPSASLVAVLALLNADPEAFPTLESFWGVNLDEIYSK